MVCLIYLKAYFYSSTWPWVTQSIRNSMIFFKYDFSINEKLDFIGFKML